MRVKTVALVTTLGLVLGIGAAQAQTAPPPTQPPAQPPATPPAATQKPEPAKPKPPVPFPEGAKLAYVDYQYIASTAEEGKAATTKIQALQKQKNGELLEKQKALQGLQQKLQASGSLMNDQARGQLEREIEKAQRDLQFAQDDANADIQQLTQQLQQAFGEKIQPILDAIAKERGLHMIFAAPANLAWAHEGLNVSEEVVKRLNSGGGVKK
jgi:Skp family chaperone for outer membrane proteins